MDDRALAERHRSSQRAYYRALVGSPGSRVVDLGGVQASVTPAAPERSVPNAVVYERPGEVLERHGELVELYRAAGVRAWTVWVRPDDDALAAGLARCGHLHDGRPPVMGAELSALDLGPRRELVVDPAPSWATVGRLNDLAYGLDGDLERTLGGIAPAAGAAWVALDGAEPIASVATFEHEGDVYVAFVAVIPAERGAGLAGELMRTALRAASERSAETTTLEASPLGLPVYERIGYRTLGRLGMWERRARNDSA